MLARLAASAASLSGLSWVFLKIGFIFFGGGFLLVPVLHRELVVRLQWLTPREFVDGVAFSQLTPGPVAILATFCGFRQGGVAGAILATLFVFLPAFALMVALSQGYSRLREIHAARAVMDGLLPAIVGLLVAAALDIGVTAIRTPVHVVMGVACVVLLYRFRVSPAVLIAAGALIGWAAGR